jgi:hypothetical protein
MMGKKDTGNISGNDIKIKPGKGGIKIGDVTGNGIVVGNGSKVKKDKK